MLGRTSAPDHTMRDVEVAQLRAAVGAARALCRTAATKHPGNADLVNLALDIDNQLKHANVPVIPGR